MRNRHRQPKRNHKPCRPIPPAIERPQQPRNKHDPHRRQPQCHCRRGKATQEPSNAVASATPHRPKPCSRSFPPSAGSAQAPRYSASGSQSQRSPSAPASYQPRAISVVSHQPARFTPTSPANCTNPNPHTSRSIGPSATRPTEGPINPSGRASARQITTATVVIRSLRNDHSHRVPRQRRHRHKQNHSNPYKQRQQHQSRQPSLPHKEPARALQHDDPRCRSRRPPQQPNQALFM